MMRFGLLKSYALERNTERDNAPRRSPLWNQTVLASIALGVVMQPADTTAEPITIADPFVLEHDGLFYLYGTFDPEPNRGIPVRVSEDLLNWSIPKESNEGFALAREDGFGDRGFWAPSLQHHDGRFYLFYTANERIAVATSDSPAGPFTQASHEPLDPDMAAIDPHLFIDDDGRKYLFFVRPRRAAFTTFRFLPQAAGAPAAVQVAGEVMLPRLLPSPSP